MRPVAILAALLALSAAARADDATAPLAAARATGAIAVDGRLDDPAWLAVLPDDRFVQERPEYGAAPSLATEVRVLFDQRALYVGIRCRDDRPAGIVRPLGRRDAPPDSDQVRVYVDGARDGRTARLFLVTAGGVLADALVYDDDRVTYEWDAVWEGAAVVDADGWTAELAIPLSVLRLAPGGALVGFGVLRDVPRLHEKMGTFPHAAGERGLASRLGALEGLVAPEAGLELALSPYVAGRMVVRPQSPAPGPRRADPISDVGLDARARVGDLAAVATLNPDFGQVEADRLVVNLSTYETQFPEKRPFFTEGLDVFQPVGAGDETVPHRLFYSRRIGLDAPILGAAKLAGRAGDGLRVGVVEALVSAPSAAPGRGLRWSVDRPLHLAPGDEATGDALAPRNFLGAVARWSVAPRAVVGAQLASAIPLGPRCSAPDAASDAPPAACATPGGEAAAADFTARSAGGDWFTYGQAAGSRVEGGPPVRTLRDGTALHPGDLGAGWYLRAGRRGGSGLRGAAELSWSAPRFDVNATGFQRTQNELEALARLEWAVPEATGALRDWSANVWVRQRRSTDGRGLPRGFIASAGVEWTLAHPWLEGSCDVWWDDPQLDLREIAGTGIPLERPPRVAAECAVATDEARPVALGLKVTADRSLARGPVPATRSVGTTATVTLRPQPRLETRAELGVARELYPVRLVEDPGDGTLTFARLTAPSGSFLLSQLWVVAPRLTLQVHAQVLTAFEDYGPFFSGPRSGRAAIRLHALRPAGAPAANPDGRTVDLVLNAVLRWEPRPGTTLHVAWARTQGRGFEDGEGGRTLAPRGLGGAPAVDSVLVKWTWWIAG
jgi:hypothetical protein